MITSKVYALLSIIFVLAGQIQSQAIFPGQARDREQQIAAFQKVDKNPYLLITITTEKCYDCGYSYAMVCGEKNPDCNTPSAPVPHFFLFESEADALDWLEKNQTHQLLRLVRVEPVAVSQTTEVKKHPQPDQEEIVRHYHADGAQSN